MTGLKRIVVVLAVIVSPNFTIVAFTRTTVVVADCLFGHYFQATSWTSWQFAK